MMYLLFAFFALFWSLDRDLYEKQEFVKFMHKFEKSYSSEEFGTRFNVFKDNLKRIEQMNVQHPRARFGVNAFADLSREEFRAQYLSRPIDAEAISAKLPYAPLYSSQQLSSTPSSYDWRTKGVVTPVKNQGQCGSCWSFSTTGNVEGQWALANHTLTSLSEQNLVDCDHECMPYDGDSHVCDQGCDGGLQPNAYTYIIKNNGIDTEASYPYEGVDGTCRFNAQNVGARIQNYTMVSKDESQMAAYLAEHGPLAIAADAVEWQFYMGGVFADIPCGTSLDHGILIVGYGSETDMLGFHIDYWIIKNSWGPSWGESGYMFIQRGVGMCGLNLFVSSSIV